MPRVSPYLHKYGTYGFVGYAHYCPGCDKCHTFWTQAPRGPKWTFVNGDVNSPTFQASMREFLPADPEDGVAEETLCHYFLKDGKIEYLGDSAHALKGQTVPLPPVPERYAEDRYAWPCDF